MWQMCAFGQVVFLIFPHSIPSVAPCSHLYAMTPRKHIFVDSPNVLKGASAGESTSDYMKDHTRIGIIELTRLIEGGSPCATKVVGGSSTTSSGVWPLYSKCGYKLLLGVGAQDRNTPSEQFVDEALHSAIAKVLLETYESTQTLVLVTGDGREKDNATSFPQLAKFAIRSGWKVEVWAWKNALSSTFTDLETDFPEKMTVRLLDEHRSEITFLQRERAVFVPQYTNFADCSCAEPSNFTEGLHDSPPPMKGSPPRYRERPMHSQQLFYLPMM